MPLYEGGLFNLTKTKPVKVTSEVLKVASIHITMMIQAASTSETSANLYQTTWCNNPEDSHLQTRVFFMLCSLGIQCHIYQNNQSERGF
jgi:hypothetical protein